MKVKFCRTHASALAPTRATPHAAGWDLYARTSEVVFAHEVKAFPVGVCLEMPEGFEAQIRPRSGLMRLGVVGLFGTIDCDYRGEINVLLMNTTSEPWAIRAHDRVGQLVFGRVIDVEWIEGRLSETKRGAGGFGSTGR